MDPAEHLRLMRTKHVTLDNTNTKVNQATGKTTKSQWATNQRVMNTKKKKYRRKMGEQIIEGGGGWSERKGTPRTGDGGGRVNWRREWERLIIGRIKSRASSKKRKATTATGKTAEEKKLGAEDKDNGCNKAVQSRRRGIKGQQLLLRNAEMFAFRKKYELVKRLM
jgi:hypothetical protein